jgi:hypothetical protein
MPLRDRLHRFARHLWNEATHDHKTVAGKLIELYGRKSRQGVDCKYECEAGILPGKQMPVRPDDQVIDRRLRLNFPAV